jgi:ABC-type transporter Mla MlaB component
MPMLKKANPMLETVSPGHYRLYGKLTMQEGETIINELITLISNKQASNKQLNINQLDLDVSQLESADSALLATIINVARSIEARNGIFRITGLSSSLSGLAKVYGIDSLIDRYRIRS